MGKNINRNNLKYLLLSFSIINKNESFSYFDIRDWWLPIIIINIIISIISIIEHYLKEIIKKNCNDLSSSLPLYTFFYLKSKTV